MSGALGFGCSKWTFWWWIIFKQKPSEPSGVLFFRSYPDSAPGSCWDFPFQEFRSGSKHRPTAELECILSLKSPLVRQTCAHPKAPIWVRIVTVLCVKCHFTVWPQGVWTAMVCGEAWNPPPPKKKTNPRMDEKQGILLLEGTRNTPHLRRVSS